MRDTWLVDIYQRIKKTHAERLSQAVSLLQKKAANDPELAEVLRLLHPWVSGQEQEEKPKADGQAQDRN